MLGRRAPAVRPEKIRSVELGPRLGTDRFARELQCRCDLLGAALTDDDGNDRFAAQRELQSGSRQSAAVTLAHVGKSVGAREHVHGRRRVVEARAGTEVAPQPTDRN